MRHLQQRFERKSERETEESSAELLSSGSISQNIGKKTHTHTHTLTDTQSSMNWWEINSGHKEVGEGNSQTATIHKTDTFAGS